MHKIKDKVFCKVESRKNGTKAVFSRELLPGEVPKLEEKEFEIIAMRPAYSGADCKMYTIVVDDDIVGWVISEFHIKYYDIDPQFKGKRFWDLTDDFFVEK